MRYLAKAVFVFAMFFAPYVDAEPAALGLRLQEGATYQWVSVNERANESSTGKQASKSTTPLSLTVLKATKEAFLVELRYGKSELSMSAERPEVQRFLNDAQDIVQSLKFKVIIDKQGQILDLQNFEEVQAVVKKLIDQLANSLKDGLPEQVRSQLQGMFSSRQVIVGVLLKDVPLLFVGAGADPNARTPVRFESEMPNPFGGEPFKATGVTSISSLPGSPNAFQLETRQSVKAESVAQMIAQMAQGKMSKTDEENMRKQLSGMNIQDHLRASIDLNTGLSSKVRFVRTTSLQDKKRIDAREFSLVQ